MFDYKENIDAIKKQISEFNLILHEKYKNKGSPNITSDIVYKSEKSSKEFTDLQYKQDRIDSKRNLHRVNWNAELLDENAMSKIIDQEKTNILHQPWNKLSNGHKKNRIDQYLRENYTHLLDNNSFQNLKNELNKLITRNLLTDKHIDYDIDNSSITNIKVLSFSDHEYHLEHITKKRKKKDTPVEFSYYENSGILHKIKKN
tara:strand:- start:1218 stop:1823 length:606 start_codon:yes stop_codon:yes gene_type:complete